MLKVSLWEKIQRILIALKEAEKQRNNGPWKDIIFLNKLKYLKSCSVVVFFSCKICGHLGNEEWMCVAGGF